MDNYLNPVLKRTVQDEINRMSDMGDDQTEYIAIKLTCALQMGMDKLEAFAKEEGITEITKEMVAPMVEWAIRLATDEAIEKRIQKTISEDKSSMQKHLVS